VRIEDFDPCESPSEGPARLCAKSCTHLWQSTGPLIHDDTGNQSSNFGPLRLLRACGHCGRRMGPGLGGVPLGVHLHTAGDAPLMEVAGPREIATDRGVVASPFLCRTTGGMAVHGGEPHGPCPKGCPFC